MASTAPSSLVQEKLWQGRRGEESQPAPTTDCCSPWPGTLNSRMRALLLTA